MPYCLGRVGRWASRNIVAAAAFLTVYGWIYTYSYIWGFYDRFDADPEQLGFGRAEETARALAIGFPLGLAWAFVVLFGAFTACAALIWLVIGGISVYRVVAHKHPIIPDPPTSSATLWRRRWISIGNHTATQSLTFLATFIIVMYAIFTPLSNYRSGEADADHMLASKRLDIAPSIMQQITGTRAQAVVLTWISPLQSPIRDAASNSVDATTGYLLAESNGVDIFFDLSTCTIYHIPTASVMLRRALETSEERAQKPTPGAQKPRTC